jgi:hypothetical protein
MCYCSRLVESSTGNERSGGKEQDLESKLVLPPSLKGCQRFIDTSKF